MAKQRESNFELLRIILMLAVPLYHMVIYAGIIYMPYNNMTAEGLLLCSGSAIVADYAFMAMSAYFFLSSKGKPIISKFLSLGIQVVILFGFKMFMIRKVLGFPEIDYYVNDFFVKGAWWFIYVYLVVLLIYPFLNKIIFQLKLSHLLGVCVVLGAVFIYHGVRNDVNFLHDLLAFLFTYFLIGYLKRIEFNRFFCFKNKKSTMLLMYIVGALLTFVFLWWVKQPGNMPTEELASDVVRCMVGKYSFIQFIMGVAVFLLFRSLRVKSNKYINDLAKNVFFVFLLHETVMAIFWYFGKMRTIDDVLPYQTFAELILWAIIYIGCCFVFAGVIRWLYDLLFSRLVEKIVTILCNTSVVQKMELFYRKIEE